MSTPHALWYNPAGLAYAKRQLLFDLSSSFVRASFTRFVDDGSIDPTVRVRSSALPLPTLAYSDDFGLRRWGFGIGIVLPPAYALGWPSEVDGQRAPQRYSILSTDQSGFGSLALAAAYRPVSPLSIGAALYLTTARVGGEVAVSACDYAVCLQPEAPEWEGKTPPARTGLHGDRRVRPALTTSRGAARRVGAGAHHASGEASSTCSCRPVPVRRR